MADQEALQQGITENNHIRVAGITRDPRNAAAIPAINGLTPLIDIAVDQWRQQRPKTYVPGDVANNDRGGLTLKLVQAINQASQNQRFER